MHFLKTHLRFICLVLLAECFFWMNHPCSYATTQAGQHAAAVSSADEQMFNHAMTAMDAGDTAKAETLLHSLHARYPSNYQINESLGLLYAGSGELKKALPFLGAAAQEQPSVDVAHMNLGAAYFKLQQTQSALREFQRAVALNPDNGNAQAALAQTEMLLHHPDKAASAFEAALHAEPDNPDLIYNTAVAEFAAGYDAKAAEYLKTMPGISLSAPAQSLYGDVEERLGHYKPAVEHYSRAVQLDPSEANGYMLGIEFLRHWTFGPAIEEFSAGVRKFPESQRMRLGLGIAYYGDGQYDKAIPVLADLLATDPNNTMNAELLGRTCTVLTEGLNPRCAALVEFSEAHPQNATLATYAAASILHKPSNATDMTTAETLLHTAIANDPKLPQAYFELGVLLQTQSKWQESIAPLETAIRLKPEYAQAHYRLSRAYSHAGRHQEAEQQIALNLKYSKEQEDNLNARMKEITTIVVNMQ